MAKKKSSKGSKSPWLGKKWQLISAGGFSEPLLLLRGPKDKDGINTARKEDNRFKLVVGGRTGRRIDYFKVRGEKKDNMSELWEKCALVPRGDQPVRFVDETGTALTPLNRKSTDDDIQKLVDKLVRGIDKAQNVSAARLECDLVVTDSGGTPNFCLLRMFQVPKGFRSKPLLVIHMAIDGGGLPDGNGGGGSVHN